jgi:branched-chain amino acid transport system permease protein
MTDVSSPTDAGSLQPTGARGPGDPGVTPEGRSRASRSLAIGAAVVAVLAVMPFLGVPLPVVLPGEISSPGALQVLAIGLVFAGLAVSYDIIFGYTGLLSFGHALFFGLGVYLTNFAMARAETSYLAAAAFAVAVTTAAAAMLGAIALRARGVAFAMVTLAYTEAFAIFLFTDPLGITGGEEGLALVFEQVPGPLTGVVNTRNLYWLALAFAVVTFLVARFLVGSLAGRVWQAVRENEDRVELLGLKPFGFKLIAFTAACALAAAGGAVYLLLVRGANPGVASAEFTLALLVMVVLGGAGRLWGAALGGLVYGLLTLRLPALATSGVLDGLPDPVERVVSEPLFILGTLFVLLVMFAPGGVAGVADRVRAALTRPSGSRRGA